MHRIANPLRASSTPLRASSAGVAQLVERNLARLRSRVRDSSPAPTNLSLTDNYAGSSSVGRAQPCQRLRSRVRTRLPLHSLFTFPDCIITKLQFANELLGIRLGPQCHSFSTFTQHLRLPICRLGFLCIPKSLWHFSFLIPNVTACKESEINEYK